MEVDVGVELVTVEGVDQRCPLLGDVDIAQMLTHDSAVFAFDQGIVIAVPGAGFGQFDQQLVEQFGDVLVDVLGAVIGMESKNDKGELFQ